MNRDDLDALMDQLLREILRGDRPRDLTGRVLGKARMLDNARRRMWLGSGAAIAASIAIAISLFAFRPRAYPAPQATDVLITYGTDLGPGSKIESAADSTNSKITLGGYVNIKMGPIKTDMTLGGSPRHEQVFLDDGHIDVQVAKKVGTFDVIVGHATVAVTGTEFTVDVDDKTQDTADGPRKVKQMKVAVLEGSVRVSDEGTTYALAASGANPHEKTLEISSDAILAATTPPDATVTPPGTGQLMNRPGNQPPDGGKRPMIPGEKIGTDSRGGATVKENLVGNDGTQDGTVILLNGSFYLQGPDSRTPLPVPDSQPGLESFKVGDRVRVTFKDGHVTQVEMLPAGNPDALTPGAAPAGGNNPGRSNLPNQFP